MPSYPPSYRLAVTGIGLFTCISVAHGAGFALIEQSVKGIGNAVAGGAAQATDATTIFYNPAGLAWLDRHHSQAEFGLHLIVPNADFKDENSTNGIGGTPIGKHDDEGGKNGVVPNLYVAMPIDDQLTLGLGIMAPFGLATEYSKSWIGRYHAVESTLATVNITPALAYRINNHFSVGAGVSAQYIDATLTNALDFGTLGFLAGIPGVRPSDPAFDGSTRVEGDDWSFGFNVGALYEFDNNAFDDPTRIGLSYRSEYDHTLDGDNTLAVPAFALPLTGLPTTKIARDAKADTTLPAIASLSAYHRVNQQLAVMADVSWTDWSVFDELRIEFEDGTASVQPENWEDSWRYALGVDYFYNSDWTLRAGIAYDETPVSHTQDRTPRIPDNSRRWVAVGASYRPTPAFSFDFAYAHLFVSDTPLNDTEVTTSGLAGVPVGSTLRGEYEASVDILSAQFQWNF